jgi:hypothetical protein
MIAVVEFEDIADIVLSQNPAQFLVVAREPILVTNAGGRCRFFANRDEFRSGDVEEIMNKASCLSLLWPRGTSSGRIVR